LFELKGLEIPRYHIGVASCQLAMVIEARSKAGAVLAASEEELYETCLRKLFRSRELLLGDVPGMKQTYAMPESQNE